jgi:putative two-component system response regulator
MNQDNSAKILIVDDEQDIRTVLSRFLAMEGHSCSTAKNSKTALNLLNNRDFDLVVSDVMMPGMSGLELLETITNLHPETAVMMVTGVNDRNIGQKALQLGADGYLVKPFRRNELVINVANTLERRRKDLLKIEREKALRKEALARTEEVRAREDEMVSRIMSTIGHRDHETGSHVKRLGMYAALVADALGWHKQMVNDVRLAAPLHDVGKIGIPDSILLNPGKLTKEDFEVMKQHCRIGAEILEGTEVRSLCIAKDIALSHHERWDGSGYPLGLTGKSIPESARLVSILDVYDALVHDRVYRPALPESEAINIMTHEFNQGLYDPEIFKCFLALLPQIRAIRLNVVEQPLFQDNHPQHMQVAGLACN